MYSKQIILRVLKSEQNLYSDLIKEAIQIYGHDVYYIDRTLVARDNVLGEDSLSKYTNTNPIEMYVEDATGYAGEKEIITQFGLENRNEITFVVNKKRFQEMDSQISLEDGTDTTGGSIQLEEWYDRPNIYFIKIRNSYTKFCYYERN